MIYCDNVQNDEVYLKMIQVTGDEYTVYWDIQPIETTLLNEKCSFDDSNVQLFTNILSTTSRHE